jgi:ERCC4-related helicase
MRNLYTVRVHSKADPSTHNRTRWKIFMKTVSIFFMVPDCLITCLRRGLMRMSDISCLIFDECHHAEGD